MQNTQLPPPPPPPRVELTIGPMFASKTSGAIDLANKLHAESADSVVFVCNLLDMERCAANFKMSSMKTVVFVHSAEPKALNVKRVWADTTTLHQLAFDADVKHVIVDELQFYSENVVRTVIIEDWVHKRRLNVHLYGLVSDSRGSMWPSVSAALPYASKLHWLTATCQACKVAQATMTTAIVTMPADGVSVGGADKYEARCRDCYMNGK